MSTFCDIHTLYKYLLAFFLPHKMLTFNFIHRFIVRGGTPAFIILVKSSEAEKQFLANY